jgi:hypothetical protein
MIGDRWVALHRRSSNSHSPARPRPTTGDNQFIAGQGEAASPAAGESPDAGRSLVDPACACSRARATPAC